MRWIPLTTMLSLILLLMLSAGQARAGNIKLTKIEQVLSAEGASGHIAKELGVETGAALLSIRRQSHNEHGDVVDVLDCLYNPNRFQYAMVLSLDS